MPLFHNMKVEQSAVKGELNGVFGFMLFFFLLPMLAIIASTFTKAKAYRSFHFGITIIYTVQNLGHIISDLLVGEPWYQIILMLVLLLIGILLNLVSFQWLESYVGRSNSTEVI